MLQNIRIMQVHAQTRKQDDGALVLLVLSLTCRHAFGLIRYQNYSIVFVVSFQFAFDLAYMIDPLRKGQ